MNKSLLIILTIILNSLLIKGDTRQCGEESINNCQVCGKYETYDSCGTCEVNHFPLMENLLCMACNDPIYGQLDVKEIAMEKTILLHLLLFVIIV